MKRIYVVDWDDTILCTTILGNISKEQNVDFYNIKMNYDLISEIKMLEYASIVFFEKLLSSGDVYIVTNAEQKWFDYTSNKYFPNLKTCLSQMKIISAIDLYKQEYPTIPLVNGYPQGTDGANWKYNAMSKIIHYADCMVSIGDSNYEKIASLLLQKQNTNKKIYPIKMIEYPKIKEIIYQLNNITHNLDFLLENANKTNNCLEFKF